MSGYRYRNMSFLPLIWENVSISVLFRLKNVVNVDILFTRKCKTKLSMCYSLQTSADGRRPRPGPAACQPDTHTDTSDSHGRSRHASTYLIQKLKSDIFCVVEVLWERHIGSVMFCLLDMAHKRRQACLPWLSSKNSDLSVRKTTLVTVERWLRMLGPGRHVTVRLRTTDPAVYLQLRS